jgi:tripartite-type tricarboxylate transporter receptor subunit TctC
LGFFGPKGTPQEVIATLNKQVNEIIAVPAIESVLIKEGADPAGGTPQQFGQFVQREFEKWRVVVRESGATAE